MASRRALQCGLAMTAAVLIATNAWAQQKFKLTETPASTKSQYLQEHIIDVGDRPGHQIRIYEIRFEYLDKSQAFAGVAIKESFTRGISDYTGWTGGFNTYVVYVLEDGSKVYARGTGTSQSTLKPDGSRDALKYAFVESFVGGTGKFRGIRGLRRGSGERPSGANSLTEQSEGEYWFEE